MNLTPQQQAAVDSDAPRILTTAPPGSGKTRVLIARVVRLLESGVHPSEVACLTFTNRASREMRERLEEERERLGASWSGRRVTVSTFHGFALQIIRAYADILHWPRNPTVRDDRDRVDLLCHIAREINPKLARCKSEGGRKRRAASQAKSPEVMRQYLRAMKEAGCLDYSLLMSELHRLLRTSPMAVGQLRQRFTHLLADENQDSSEQQLAIIEALGFDNTFMVADPGQAIYSFRGAHPQGVHDLAADPSVEVHDLGINWRSVPPIVHLVSRVAEAMTPAGLQQTPGRPASDLDTSAVDTMASASTCDLHADITADLHRTHDAGTPWSEMAVLAPQWAPLQDLAKHFEDAGISCDCPKGRTAVWSCEEARWLVNLLRVAVQPHDHLALRAVLSHAAQRLRPWEWAQLRSESVRSGESILQTALGAVASRTIKGAASALVCDIVGTIDLMADGEHRKAFEHATGSLRADLTALHLSTRLKTLTSVSEALSAWQEAAEDPTVLAFLDWYAEREVHDAEEPEEGEGSVKLYSIHAAKGLEWDAVWALAEEGSLPRSRKPGAGLEEERRLFYVACSRARDRLRMAYRLDAGPSRFIAEAMGTIDESEAESVSVDVPGPDHPFTPF